MKNKKKRFFQKRKIIPRLIKKTKDQEIQIKAKDAQIKKLEMLNRTLKSHFELPQKPQEDTQSLRDETIQINSNLVTVQKKFDEHLANCNLKNKCQTNYSLLYPVDYSLLSSDVWNEIY